MIGQTLNKRYKITSRLGKGAMGTVYLANDTKNERQVALKVIAGDLAVEPDMLERFKREGEALRQLKHPNIVGFIDAFQDGEQYIIVMEYISGGSLYELIKSGPLAIEKARQIALDLCDALIRAHRLNIIHRDIKPENILIDEDGTPKLADFGVARLSEGTRMTRSGMQVGTPYYMSPEAWKGEKLDGQTDIWSLGVVLFEMLSGKVPFEGDTGHAVMTKVFSTQAPDLRKLRSEVPSALVKIVGRMLTRDKKRRYQTIRQVGVDLESGQMGSTPKPTKPAGGIVWSNFRPSLSNLRFFAVIGLLITGVVVGINFLSSPKESAPTEFPIFIPEQDASETQSISSISTERKGGWLDQIEFSAVSPEIAIAQLQSGAIDIYGTSLLPIDFPAIKDADLGYSMSFGPFYDILYNPAPFNDTNTLNPFSNRKIREATNWLYDRDYINQEIYANAGLPKFFALQTNGREYIDHSDIIPGLETNYAYNLDKARQVILDEMIALGAELGVDGKWQFRDQPVTLIFLIRNDGDGTRQPLGDYVADQLEDIGFSVDRQYQSFSKARTLFADLDPTLGQWNLYTAGWVPARLDFIDEKNAFRDMYLPASDQGLAFQANSPDANFEQVGNDLANNNFTTVVQRHQMISQVLELSLQDSLQVWLIDTQKYTPYNKKVQVASDLLSGPEGAQAWPFTIRISDEEGGTLNWAALDILIDPWNPVAGSESASDQSAIYATQGAGVMTDPSTGLVWPLRIERAEVTVENGLAVQSALDWVTLKTANSINVPADAWVDWDPNSQTFITVESGTTAKVKSVVYYPNDLFQTVKWHDGSPLSVGDFVMSMIMIFDPSKPESAIYDETNQPQFDTFMETFKGMKIVSTDPLVIEYYTDAVHFDAELNVYSMWPMYGYGRFGVSKFEAGWHVVALTNMAESKGELAYSIDKAESSQIEWMNLIGGASLDLLSAQVEDVAAENLIPFSPTMSQFVTSEEASARYVNLNTWYAAHNHFWIGTGPYYLDIVSIEEKTLTLKHNNDYPDSADRWSFLVK